MNFQNLDYFVATATELNFTKAASKLFITQQSLSSQIAALERELDCRLFIRSKPLKLTKAGEVFYSYATGLLRDYHKMLSDVRMHTHTGKNVVQVGVSFYGAISRLWNTMSDYMSVLSTVQLQFREMPGGLVGEKLRDGTIDFAIAHFPENDPAYAIFPLYDEEIVLLVTDDLLEDTFGHAAPAVIKEITEKGNFSLLSRCPYIKTTRNSILADFANRFIEENISTPIIMAETDSVETAVELSRSGAAFCLVPRHITSDLLHDSTLSPFRVFTLGESAHFTVHYGYLKNSPRSEAIMNYLSEEVKARQLGKKKAK